MPPDTLRLVPQPRTWKPSRVAPCGLRAGFFHAFLCFDRSHSSFVTFGNFSLSTLQVDQTESIFLMPFCIYSRCFHHPMQWTPQTFLNMIGRCRPPLVILDSGVMMKSFSRLSTQFWMSLLTIGLLIFSLGCGEDHARLRVVHASPDAPNVDVLVDGKSVLTNVPYATASDYLTVTAGTRRIEVRP